MTVLRYHGQVQW